MIANMRQSQRKYFGGKIMKAETERNRTIYEECLNGASYKQLAEKYGITPSRVKDLFEREDKKEKNRSNEIFLLLETFCEDEQLKSKTLTVLERMEATTTEVFLGLDEKKIKKARGCGPKMQELILKIKEELEKKYVS